MISHGSTFVRKQFGKRKVCFMSSVYKSIVAGLTEAIKDNRSADKKLKSIMRQKYRQF